MPKVIIDADAPRRSMLTRLAGAMPKIEGWRTINSITVRADHIEVVIKDSPFKLRVYVDGAPKSVIEANLKFVATKWKDIARELYVAGKIGDDLMTLADTLKIKEGA